MIYITAILYVAVVALVLVDRNLRKRVEALEREVNVPSVELSVTGPEEDCQQSEGCWNWTED